MLLVGVVQLLVVVSIAAGAAGRLGALVTIPVIIKAIVTASVNAANVLVLVGCIGIILLGTGNFSMWGPFQFGE